MGTVVECVQGCTDSPVPLTRDWGMVQAPMDEMDVEDEKGQTMNARTPQTKTQRTLQHSSGNHFGLTMQPRLG